MRGPYVDVRRAINLKRSQCSFLRKFTSQYIFPKHSSLWHSHVTIVHSFYFVFYHHQLHLPVCDVYVERNVGLWIIRGKFCNSENLIYVTEKLSTQSDDFSKKLYIYAEKSQRYICFNKRWKLVALVSLFFILFLVVMYRGQYIMIYYIIYKSYLKSCYILR